MQAYRWGAFAALCLMAACSDADSAKSGYVTAPETQPALVSDDTPDFLPKDMAWMPADIWLPDDFEPRQSQKMSPVADTYVLRGITQMTAVDLASAYSAKMAEAKYESYERGKAKPGRMMFRGNGHGTIVITISEAGPGHELVISVENASGN